MVGIGRPHDSERLRYDKHSEKARGRGRSPYPDDWLPGSLLHQKVDDNANAKSLGHVEAEDDIFTRVESPEGLTVVRVSATKAATVWVHLITSEQVDFACATECLR